MSETHLPYRSTSPQATLEAVVDELIDVLRRAVHDGRLPADQVLLELGLRDGQVIVDAFMPSVRVQRHR